MSDPIIDSRRVHWWSIGVVAVTLLCSCGETRRFGDSGGAPVQFQVHLEKPFFDSMKNNQWRPSVGAGGVISSGGGGGLGVGVGLTFTTTQVYLLGGDDIGQAQVFRQELKWGDNSFQVPLLAGHRLALTVQAEGGREGWESLGFLTVPAAAVPAVAIALTGDGVRFAITPPPAIGAAATAPATTTPPPVPPPPSAAPADAAHP